MGTLSDNAFASSRSQRSLRLLLALAAPALLLWSTEWARAVDLSAAETARIGKRVWQNECGGTVAGLTSWNAGENFASLGIGHFIWFPAGARGPFEESFPAFEEYAAAHGRELPLFFSGKHDQACPWNSRAEFERDLHSPKMEELRRFLAASIDLQAAFLVKRLQDALPKMAAASGAADRENVTTQFNRVASSGAGCYALVDYVNFKGEGVLPTERYAGAGWGLLQVLEGMSAHEPGPAAVREFAQSASVVLTRRVKNAPAERKESRWLAGWLNRVRGYSR